MIRRPVRRAGVVGVLLLGALAGAPALSGPWVGVDAAAQAVPQGGRRADENRALREAQALETAGDRAGAEAVLRAFLERQPASTGALFALERLLRPQGRLGELLPVVDRGIAEGENESAVRYLKLRLLVEVDSADAVGPEVDRWIAERPGSLDPYREGARALERAGGPEAALSLLERGSRALGPTAPLALDAGDVLLRAGRVREAGVRWGEALEGDPTQLSGVVRRLQGMAGADRATAAEALVEELSEGAATPSRLRAATRVALEGGSVDRARAVAERAASTLRGNERETFLEELAADAAAAGEPGLAAWALETLRPGLPSAAARDVDGRIALLALAAGDSARALAARNREAEGWPRGSSDRRRALAAAIRLEAARGPASAVRTRVSEFRTEFPGATELDDLSGAVARQLLAEGDSAGARGVLQSMGGASAARERALLALGGDDPREARDDLLEAIPSVPAVQATEFLQLVSLMDLLSDTGLRLAATASLRGFRGDPAGGFAEVEAGVGGIPATDRPALLALGARLAAEGGVEEGAVRLRERLIRDHPESAEAGEATLWLARFRARTPEGVAEAIGLLEAFILSRPTSPAAPEARRELARLQRQVPGGERE